MDCILSFTCSSLTGLVTCDTKYTAAPVMTNEIGEKWRKLTLPTAILIHSGRASSSPDPQGGSRKPNSRTKRTIPTKKPNSRPKKAP